MKAKEALYLLGLRPKPRSYGYEIVSFDLGADGIVEYAGWLHPREAERALEAPEVAQLRGFLRPGDVAIDIGAHTGDSALPIALAVGPEGCVLAFEPNPYVFPVLEKNSQLNPGRVNMVPLMFAAAPTDGELEFEYSDSGFCNGGRHEGISKWRHAHAFKLVVQGRNLENFLRTEHPGLIPRIRYIKVDAEGFDFEVLKSISGLLAEVRPFVKAEVFSRSPRPVREGLFALLESLGYTIHRVTDSSHYLGEAVSAKDVMRWRHFDVFCVPGEQSVR